MPQLVDYGNVVSSMHTTIVTVWFLQVEINGVKVEFIMKSMVLRLNLSTTIVLPVVHSC